MQRITIIALLSTMLACAGCSNSNPLKDRFGQNVRPAPDQANIPLAETPKILPQTHYAAGRLFESQGQVAKAIEQYQKAVAVNHSFAEGYHRLGRMLNVAGQHDKALTALARAVELAPSRVAYRNDLGFELMFVESWADAERQLRKTIDLDPTFARAHINLAMVLSRTERFDEALEEFKTVLPDPDAHYNLGLMYRGQKRYAQAAESFRRVLEINPEFPAAKVQLEQMTARAQTTPQTDEPGTLEPQGLIMPAVAGVDSQPNLPTPFVRPVETEKPSDAPLLIFPTNSESAERTDKDRGAAVRTTAQSPPQPAEETPPAAIAAIEPAPTTNFGTVTVRIDANAPAGNEPAFAETKAVATIAPAPEKQPNPAEPAVMVILDDAGDTQPRLIQAQRTNPGNFIPTLGAAFENSPTSTTSIAPAQLVSHVSPPADLTAELILDDFARSALAAEEPVRPEEPAQPGDWRAAFEDLMYVANQTHNEFHCWRDLDERAKALLAASTPATPPRPQPTNWPTNTEPKPQPNTGGPILGSPPQGGLFNKEE